MRAIVTVRRNVLAFYTTFSHASPLYVRDQFAVDSSAASEQFGESLVIRSLSYATNLEPRLQCMRHHI